MSSPGTKSLVERLIKQMEKEGGPPDDGVVLLLTWRGLCRLLDGFLRVSSPLPWWDQAQREGKGRGKPESFLPG